jgi:hypothetical protein
MLALTFGDILVARPRHFGGKLWYFLCPLRHRLGSVLWKPSGATRFCSRQTWGRQFAYQSQFNDATNRAHAGKARIKSRQRLLGVREMPSTSNAAWQRFYMSRLSSSRPAARRSLRRNMISTPGAIFHIKLLPGSHFCAIRPSE